MPDELLELQIEYDRFRQRINPFDGVYSLQTERSDDGSPHVEFSDGQYHYIVSERGLELERSSTADIHEIVYWMLKDVTFWQGVAFEFKNRIESQDCRRMIFAHQIEFMKLAKLQFAERLEREIAETLRQNPYNDQA
ncbi:MAG TPA: Imm63 family immunity protein [Pyrinomonadaceae bacterium]|nr:Imm63 family immunity protein [Pyrinomonadaceae bacterium]